MNLWDLLIRICVLFLVTIFGIRSISGGYPACVSYIEFYLSYKHLLCVRCLQRIGHIVI